MATEFLHFLVFAEMLHSANKVWNVWLLAHKSLCHLDVLYFDALRHFSALDFIFGDLWEERLDNLSVWKLFDLQI